MNRMYLNLGVIIFLLITCNFINAQTTYTASENDSKVVIEGTSNIHDWEMNVESLKSTLVLNNNAETIKAVNFEVPVESMKSGKSKMDKNTYKALKEDKYEKIVFSSSTIEETDNKFYATGKLTIAGVTKDVRIPFNFSKQNNQLALNLDYEINMLDYKVEPPTALFGTITTGENVNVIINLIFK